MVEESTSQNQIIVISGANSGFSRKDLPSLFCCVDQAEILLTQLETNLEPVEQLLAYAHKRGVLTILNPAPAHPLSKQVCRYVDILTPNETEAQILTGVQVSDDKGARKAAHILLERGIGKVIITLGSRGVYACDGETERLFPAIACGAVVDTTGAGDAFSGGLTAALARGMNFFEAAAYGTVVAGLAVTKYGTAPSMPYQREIDKIFSACWNGKAVICS